ncbi:hypothetical protein [Elioraea sp.]|jgi:hypothetical protein|uniref:hypothetical protein n=1 Tax=Elioraea sp. TaxID=2185103 RepID=UPI003F6FC2B6
MAKRKTWIVTLSGERKPAEVRSELAAAGFAVRDVLDAIGVITGEADAASVARARKIKGIADIAADTQVGIGPPESDKTW